MRSQVTDQAEKKNLAREKLVHIGEVMADRAVKVRGHVQCEKCANEPSPDGFGQLCGITIDGMDQAKFRVPRNLKSSALLGKLWRPQLHVVGVIIHGHIEAYFLLDPDSFTTN